MEEREGFGQDESNTANTESEEEVTTADSLSNESEQLGSFIEKDVSEKGLRTVLQKISLITINKDGKSSALSSQETLLSRKSTGDFCRICHDVASTEKLISPCNCKGSLSLVHQSCLERWLAESDTSQCELCAFRYRVQRFPKHSLLMSVVAWMTSQATWRDRRNLLVDVLALCILSPIVCLSTMMALQLMDSLFAIDQVKIQENKSKVTNNVLPDVNPKRSVEILGTMMARVGQMAVISMILTMDMAFISWVAMRVQKHVISWYWWYRRNCKVTLTDYAETGVPSTSSALPILPPPSHD